MAQSPKLPARSGLGRRMIPYVAVTAIIALIGTLAVFADGYDAKSIPPLETSVWVTRDAGQYARVNTDLAEIDTVRTVADPTGVAQSGADAVVFSNGYRQLWPVSAANPVNLTAAEAPVKPSVESGQDAKTDESDAPAAAQNTPIGTRQVLSEGNYLLYLTDTGSVFVSSLTTENGQPPTAFPVNPFANVKVEEGEDPPVYAASAVALSPSGRVLMYSSKDRSVRTFDAQKGEFVGDPSPVQSPPDSDARLELAVAGDSWALSSAGDGKVWLSGREQPVETGLGGESRLQPWSQDAHTIHVADQNTLISISFSTGEVNAVATGNGVPAAPIEVDGVVYAAWLGTSTGALWSSATDRSIQVDVEGDQLSEVQAIVPRFYGNGARAVLAEQSTGLLWTVPDGKAIPVDQWTLGEDDHETGTVKVDDLPQQEPPVAVADTFGVRAGRLVSLPVLLNDHDPNKKDVLSIVPDSISGGLGDPAFGELALVGNDQTAVVQVNASSGSTTFMYAVTDGKAQSAPAPVTLTIIPDTINSAPQWCPVEGCVQQWPTPKLAPGGTAVVPVMDGWVDPEGDPIVLEDVRKVEPNAPVSVVPMSDGTVAIRHNDPNAGALVILLTVVVSDSRGAVTEKELEVSVGASPSIKASPVAVTASVGQKVTVTIADHVQGGSGAYRVVDAVQASSNDGGLVVVPNAAGGTVDVSASEVGEYIISYSVQDAVTLSEQSSIIRLTVVPAGRPLSMAPLTAFVRANEDTTVDVLSAVQNTSGRVLLVSGATSSSHLLNVSVVAQSRLRVSGTTADDKPGLIGTARITVSDGSGAEVYGEVAVFLVPSAIGVGPMAVPDSATVRAGTQVDIPVLRNDLSPRGERLVVHPEVQGSGTSGELAFASESNVRYLAPTVPGVYTISYSVYLEGRPDRVDTATVTVTVIAAGSNRPPEPPVLNARTNAGQTVLIPVDSYGMDPDGDHVTLTDVELPSSGKGVPSVSPDGGSIVYAAPAAGVPGGQVSFEYTVRDSNGATATGRVRVGVISANLLDLTPVTYSDYVQVLQGSATPIKIQPLLNDRDPAQGALEIISIRPNAPGDSTNPEYARLEALIDSSTSLKDGEVVLHAGDTLGTQSFIYTVQSLVSTSTAEGLIVVGVAESVAPDMPVVTDTVVTAKDRNQLSSGIDVVSGKVRWVSGDVSGLTLSLWGSAADRYQVNGARISGDFPPKGDLVPFVLTGKDSSGTEVTAHGFLRIPAFDELRVQLKSNAKRVEVNEEKSVEFDIRDLLDVDKSDVVELKTDDGFVVQRQNASCESVSGTLARYNSGREAPWVDMCAFPVRLKGQKLWSTVAVPVWILPKDPQAILSTISRTLTPGESATIDLYESLTTWEGGRVGDQKLLDYAAAFSGTAFVVEQSGRTLSIQTRADAVPGTREPVQVSVSNFGGLVGGVTLVVGIAPPDAPRGATLSQTCDVSRGASCAITVVGMTGEYDPFAGKIGGGLKVVSVGTGDPVVCPVATVAVGSDKQLVATWPAGPRPVGGVCVVPMTVADAQGRTGPGQLTIDVQGYPRTPASVTTSLYDGTSVTLTVPLGDESHPLVTSVQVLEGGSRVTGAICNPIGSSAFSCTVPGLVNGIPHTYTARAVNGVGDSLDTTPHETWAYRKPTMTSVSAVPVFDPARTTLTAGAVDLTITSTDVDVRGFRVKDSVDQTGPEYPRNDASTVVEIALRPGTRAVQVIPISKYRPPINFAGSNGEGDLMVTSVTAVGTPSYGSNGTATGDGSGNVTLNGASFNGNGGALREQKYVAWPAGGGEPTCTASGDSVTVAGGTSSSSSTITMPPNGEYYIKACATNGYGIAESEKQGADTYPEPGAPTGTRSYLVAKDPTLSPHAREYPLVSGPAVTPMPGWVTTFFVDGAQVAGFAPSTGAITVRYCRDRVVLGGQKCGISAPITYDVAPTPVTVTFPSARVSQSDAQAGVGIVVSGVAASLYSVVLVDLDPAAKLANYRVTFTSPYELSAAEFSVKYEPDPAPPTP